MDGLSCRSLNLTAMMGETIISSRSRYKSETAMRIISRAGQEAHAADSL